LAENLTGQLQQGAWESGVSLREAAVATGTGAITGKLIGSLVPSGAPHGLTAGVGEPTGKNSIRQVRDLHTMQKEVKVLQERWRVDSILRDRSLRQILRVPANVLRAMAIGIMGRRK
jgi:hypothetical protein